ncbi:hypothetical protein MBM_05224 [Drepanopeziza brunnea f. sp. 'multigermtubi' MB_m1]|uniref:Uncharacterized protein n=1 Tax=Marssonina brunnea f. sp. multigermtubi (strain MB_m1) TaxID=1072389 RepID=K1WGR5_MARBU|nr:uncharacterized protein MBM_05224 [Drepanopeziza brunnea f. sp. 'multigermtubi' MB_m1]EKD16755.1 hypothetical protein MBM_05224 [Drepanopeziza brunnea f. sp. 'multigermtubi' MB_m1]
MSEKAGCLHPSPYRIRLALDDDVLAAASLRVKERVSFLRLLVALLISMNLTDGRQLNRSQALFKIFQLIGVYKVVSSAALALRKGFGSIIAAKGWLDSLMTLYRKVSGMRFKTIVQAYFAKLTSFSKVLSFSKAV